MGSYAHGIVVRQRPDFDRLRNLSAYITDYQIYEWPGTSLWCVNLTIGRGFPAPGFPTRWPAALRRLAGPFCDKVKFSEARGIVVTLDLSDCLDQAVLSFQAPDEFPEEVYVCEPGRVALAYHEPWTFQAGRIRNTGHTTNFAEYSQMALNDFAGRDVAVPDSVTPDISALRLVARRGQRGTITIVEPLDVAERPRGLSLKYELTMESRQARIPGWSVDGRFLLTEDVTDNRSYAQIREAETGRVLHTLQADAMHYAWSPTEPTLVTLVRDFTTATDQLVWWNALSGERRRTETLPKGEQAFCGLAWSPDGRLLLAAQEYGNGLWLIDAHSGRVAKNFARQSGFQSVAWSPDSKRLVAAGRKKLMLFDRDGNKIWSVTSQAEWIASIAWSPDGKTLASPAGAKVRLTDARTGKGVGFLEADKDHFVNGESRGLSAVSYSADGGLVAASGDGHGFLWSLGRDEKPTAFDSAGPSLAFHPHEPLLATGGPNQKLRIWEVDT
jgi:WD40 repeat protein